MRTLLHDGWTLRPVGGSGLADVPPEVTEAAVPATVPGCVHTDLLAADLIPDPYLDDNEAVLAWIGCVDWRYETSFDWEPDASYDHVDLVCDGLDTVAVVELNGVEIARTQNMHRTYRFGVREALRPGRNELSVTFASALDHVERVQEERGALPHVNRFPFNAVRKMACNFGWDWGPELITAGIWRPLALESWSGARLDAVRTLVTVEDGAGRVAVHADVARGAAGREQPLRLTAKVGEHRAETTLPAGAGDGVVDVVVPDPELWWPRGYGEQPLYPVHVELSTVDGTVLGARHGNVGFRTVELDNGVDEHGTRYTFVVNGVPVFAKGANWIPDDCFPHRVDRQRYAARIAQATDAGLNLLRVWGGGIYESDDFYDVCDEQGVLVWQDFLFACAAYDEDEPLRSEVIAEATQAVTRLTPHPSLVLWNGCNENIWGYHDWGWQEKLAGRAWGMGYYQDVLPKIVAELDPTRPYSPGSPWSWSADLHPNNPDHGCMHIWDVWNQRDYAGYRDYVPRFLAEFGFCGPPTMSTLLRAVHDEPLTPECHGMRVHNKAANGPDKLARGLAGHFPEPANFADWFWATQLNQARAISFGIDHFRSWSPRCAGTVLWQLNDCWPVTSWAVVDGDARLKPAWYALRRSYADRLLTVQPREQGLALVAVNDTDQAWSGRLDVRRLSFDGTGLAATELTVDVPARGTTTVIVPAELASAGTAATEVLVAAAEGVERAFWFFAPDLEQALPDHEFTATTEPVAEGYRVRVTAHTLLRDLTLLADQVAADAVVDQALVTLLPGDSTSFLVRTSAEFDPALLAAPEILRSANQLRAG